MPGVSICKEDITITNIYAFNKGVPKCIKQKLTEMKGEIKNLKIIVQDFNTPLSIIDKTTRQKVRRKLNTWTAL